MVADDKDWQEEKAKVPTEVTVLGMVTEVRPERANARIPIYSTDSGMVISVRLVQSPKASLPIEVTELGMSTSARLEQREKADDSIDLTEEGMVTDVRASQPEKAAQAIDSTLLGISIDSSFAILRLFFEVHPKNGVMAWCRHNK